MSDTETAAAASAGTGTTTTKSEGGAALAADDTTATTTSATTSGSSAGIRFQISGSSRSRRNGPKERAGLDGFGRDEEHSRPHGSSPANTTTTGATNGGTIRRDATSFSKEEHSADGNVLPVIPVKPNTRLKPGAVAKESMNHSDGPEAVVSSGVRPLAEAVPSAPRASGAAPVVEDNVSEREAEQYKRQVMALPDEPTIDDYHRNESAIPISQFGAALLRGMGWKGDNDEVKRDEEAAMPRPHRLGLGAIPKAAAIPSVELDNGGGNKAGSTTRPRRPDQVRQDERLKRQLAEFASQRKERVAQDKQAVLQDGSVVYLENASGNNRREYRAKVVQLVGVPGLNKVKVELEHDEDKKEYGRLEFIVNRRDIGGLVCREDLTARPFVSAPASQEVAEKERGGSGKRNREKDGSEEDLDLLESSRKRSSKSRSSYGDDDDGSDRDSHDDPESRRRDKKKRKESKSDRSREDDRSRNDRRGESGGDRREQWDQTEDAWLIPHIRVRVASSKYGQRHFQQKGVVVDVTPKGATVQMDDSRSTLLDRVPARHLTTALPKAGGCAIVVQGDHRRAMGTVLQRDSRVAVLQLDEDHSVLTLPLDDLAEWCGPRNDE